jgi:hypothetical protein
MTIELMVRYERAPDLELLKERVQSCLQRQLGVVAVPTLSYADGWSGEHVHEVNVFLQANPDIRTWLLIAPLERLDEPTEPAESWVTVASTGTAQSVLLTLATAACLAELVDAPITDDAGLLGGERHIAPDALLKRLEALCQGRELDQAAACVAETLAVHGS